MDTYFFTYSWAHHPSGLFCSSPCCWSSALTLNSVVSNPSSPESLITGPNISDQGDSTSPWSWLSSCASSDCPWSLKAEFTSSNLWISTLLLECLCYGNFQNYKIYISNSALSMVSLSILGASSSKPSLSAGSLALRKCTNVLNWWWDSELIGTSSSAGSWSPPLSWSSSFCSTSSSTPPSCTETTTAIPNGVKLLASWLACHPWFGFQVRWKA